jgi:hypothetical protein
MREDEAAATQERLRAVVREAGLQWVLDQVDEFALEGKPEFKRVKPADRDDTEPHVRELISKRGVPRSEPYTEAERLALLAEALERITSQPLQLEAEIAASVMKDDGLDDVVWVDELEREPTRSALEAERRDENARTARDELLPILMQLRARARE